MAHRLRTTAVLRVVLLTLWTRQATMWQSLQGELRPSARDTWWVPEERHQSTCSRSRKLFLCFMSDITRGCSVAESQAETGRKQRCPVHVDSVPPENRWDGLSTRASCGQCLCRFPEQPGVYHCVLRGSLSSCTNHGSMASQGRGATQAAEPQVHQRTIIAASLCSGSVSRPREQDPGPGAVQRSHPRVSGRHMLCTLPSSHT